MTSYLSNLKKTKEIYKDVLYDSKIIKNGNFISGSKKLTPAKCVFIEDELNRLFKLRRDKYIKYDLLKDKILYNDKPSSFKKEFEELYEEINSIQNDIDAIYTYYDEISLPNSDVDKTRLEILYKKIQTDKTLIPEYVKTYIKFMKSKPKDEELTYLVKSPPKFVNKESKDEVKKDDSSKKLKKLSNDNVNIIKKNIKDLVKQKFKAKTLEECKTKQRSKEYFMKKEEILDIIEKNPEMKKLLPANYKSLDKDNLCRYIFD